jgi:hypothetical protein
VFTLSKLIPILSVSYHLIFRRNICTMQTLLKLLGLATILLSGQPQIQLANARDPTPQDAANNIDLPCGHYREHLRSMKAQHFWHPNRIFTPRLHALTFEEELRRENKRARDTSYEYDRLKQKFHKNLDFAQYETCLKGSVRVTIFPS